jgi:hypothetical protein
MRESSCQSARNSRLACAPARVTGQEFILRTAATHVLAQPDFLSRDAAVMQPDNPDGAHVQFRSGPHTLIAKTIEGSYPDYRCAIPGNPAETVTVADKVNIRKNDKVGRRQPDVARKLRAAGLLSEAGLRVALATP